MFVTDKDKKELKAKAEAAGNVFWFSHHCFRGERIDCWCKVIGTSPDPTHEDMDSVVGAGSVNATNADFIAAANPITILRLLAEIKHLQDCPFDCRYEGKHPACEVHK